MNTTIKKSTFFRPLSIKELKRIKNDKDYIRNHICLMTSIDTTYIPFHTRGYCTFYYEYTPDPQIAKEHRKTIKLSKIKPDICPSDKIREIYIDFLDNNTINLKFLPINEFFVGPYRNGIIY